MIILLSPAKRINFAPVKLPVTATVSDFEMSATSIMDHLELWTLGQTRANLNLGEQLGEIAYNRNKRWKLPETLQTAKPAIFAYDGDVYRAMEPMKLSKRALKFAVRHLRILSALYGMLLPSDMIKPYRLQMSTPITVGGTFNLYDFWSEKLNGRLSAQLRDFKNPLIINLASEEYFQVIDESKLNAKIIKPVFKQYHNGSNKVLSLYTKIARGLMTRFIIENQIQNPEHLKAFDQGGYTFVEGMSTSDRLVFIKSIS